MLLWLLSDALSKLQIEQLKGSLQLGQVLILILR